MAQFNIVKLLNGVTLQSTVVPKGAYDNGATYLVGDAVSYTDGNSYVAIQTTTGNIPTNATYWMLLASQGTSGYSGRLGYSGTSGYSGYSGTPGTSGYSGANPGASGTSGYSGTSGTSGYSGTSGTSGTSGYSGISGTSGYSGTSGTPGYSGTSGTSGYSGTSGFSGTSGTSGAAPATLTNTRINPRITSAASYTTNTGTSLDISVCDEFVITAQTGALKFNNPGGTPVEGQKLIIRIKDNATAHALTWDTTFRASSDLALPTTTILSKTLYMGFIYNYTDTKWDIVALLNNF